MGARWGLATALPKPVPEPTRLHYGNFTPPAGKRPALILASTQPALLILNRPGTGDGLVGLFRRLA